MKPLSNTPLYIALASLCMFILYDISPKHKKQPKKAKTEKAHVIKIDAIKTDVQKKKREFIELIVPIIDKVYNDLEVQYQEISRNMHNMEYKEKISELKEKYDAKNDRELLMALKPHPKSIAIAQAAMESAWAKSRFFKEANNLYGMWSINKDKPRIAASQSRGEKIIWLKKYATLEESIKDYYKTLARSKAYKDFRELKMQTDDPYELVLKLDRYSEIGDRYAEDLIKIMRYNKLDMYD